MTKKKITKVKTILEKVHSYKTKYSEGFLQSEIQDLLKDYPGIDMVKFDEALNGITCVMIGGKLVFYPCDVELALRSGIGEKIHTFEWD